MKVMFLHLSVILFEGCGMYTPLHAGIPPRQTPPADIPPLDRHPTGREPPRQTHPPPRPRILQDTVNKRTVRILLECILVVSLRILFSHHNVLTCQYQGVKNFTLVSIGEIISRCCIWKAAISGSDMANSIVKLKFIWSKLLMLVTILKVMPIILWDFE